MNIARMTATTLAALSVATFGGAVAHAEPTTAGVPDIRGSIEQLTYNVTTSDDRRSVVADLVAGRFQVSADGKVVSVKDGNDNIVAALPTLVHVADRSIPLAATVEHNGQRLTLAPATAASAPLRNIGANQDRFFDELNKAQPQVAGGAALGAAIGFVLGFPLGLFVFDIITVPITTVLGGLIGAYVGLQAAGGQQAVDAARAYFENPNG